MRACSLWGDWEGEPAGPGSRPLAKRLTFHRLPCAHGANKEKGMAKNTYRVVTRASDGALRIRDFDSEEPLLRMHVKIGIDDCSTDLDLRGKPVQITRRLRP